MLGIHCNGDSKEIVDCLQTLLLFLLADPRANRPQNPFTHINNAKNLKNSQKPILGHFSTDDNVPTDVIVQELKTLLDKIENENFDYNWHKKIMKDQIVCILFHPISLFLFSFFSCDFRKNEDKF